LEIMDDKVSIGQVLSPVAAMQLALHVGANGVGHVAPNPLVGCVILDHEYRLLASGWHRKIGHDHAEVDALIQIANRDKLRGAHVFVTLEPCAHQGRTPSCAKTLATQGLSSLTYAVEDPNPLVAGQGADILRKSGVRVRLVSEHEQIGDADAHELVAGAEELAEIFLHNMRSKESFVAVKVASTLDGKMALASGESKWITNAKSREYTHLLRARYDAVAVGRNTFVTDDPSLNVRHGNFPSFENNVLIFDPMGHALSALAQSKVLQVRRPERVIVVVNSSLEFSNPLGVRLVPVSLGPKGSFEVGELLMALKNQGLTSIMIEGGAQTFAPFFAAKKVQRVHVFQAPLIIGGRHGVPWSSGFGVERMADGLRLERVSRKLFDEDSYLTGRVTYP
jgi:diaminohydroxyphosphoribosylaminopyrimidine deaminase/5-amino-6-(5-phosphoribosylamino)uracil reductase